jgi:hypothetical protein
VTVPGDELALAASAPSDVNVTADIGSIAPIDTLDIIVNGSVAQTVRAADPGRASFRGRVAVPDGGWIAARVSGPKSQYLGDDYAPRAPSPEPRTPMKVAGDPRAWDNRRTSGRSAAW